MRNRPAGTNTDKGAGCRRLGAAPTAMAMRIAHEGSRFDAGRSGVAKGIKASKDQKKKDATLS
ncbi:hypothetical protein EI171_11315 [Bradyrhizobium sp. LCT2]|uniref:hypothetical protein n=1 Tax=Bradyrhizobium sp. LCT2 TaxID=2493093 RepID=UPI001374018C|nr:hypothetical protein [Bradyrhizobium sp. LCT2]QHP67903.1 hypothetical protein EI171_11315 [Bradyrhizobium sp. LCT2]